MLLAIVAWVTLAAVEAVPVSDTVTAAPFEVAIDVVLVNALLDTVRLLIVPSVCAM